MGLRFGAGAGPGTGTAAGAAPESGVTPLAGFETEPRSGVTSMAGFAGAGRPHRPGGRSAIPAALRYSPAVSRRTPVARWMRRSAHPSRPSAMTCCFFSSLKTLLISTEGKPPVVVNVLSQLRWPVLRCPSMAGFGCPPRLRMPDVALERERRHGLTMNVRRCRRSVAVSKLVT